MHLDHAGGIGHLIQRFPKVRVLVYDKSPRQKICYGRYGFTQCEENAWYA
ncbi:MAG: hypothetical protein QXL78_00955 [Methanocellales archaeon]